jgi:MFS family permease
MMGGTPASSAPDVALTTPVAISIFTLFMVVALSAGLVFNTLSVALPKIVDERIGGDIPLVVVGGLSTAVFLCGGLAQIAVGRLVERFPPHLLFAAISVVQSAGVAWAVHATGATLLLALAVTMAAIYGQITVNDLVIARYPADAWRGRVYAVRYFLTFMVSGVAVSMIAFLCGRGGFDLVLGVTAAVGVRLARCRRLHRGDCQRRGKGAGAAAGPGGVTALALVPAFAGSSGLFHAARRNKQSQPSGEILGVRLAAAPRAPSRSTRRRRTAC